MSSVWVTEEDATLYSKVQSGAESIVFNETDILNAFLCRAAFNLK